LSFLIDTNIISEVRKGDRCDAAVAAWRAGVAEDDLWLSALVLAAPSSTFPRRCGAAMCG
jgi:predicted nucleic acid-binding protein